jgi:hypothetical protein
MGTFVVSPDLPAHARAMRAGNAALGLWVRSGAWTASTGETLIPEPVALLLGTRGQIRRLLDAELWTPYLDGYAIEPLLGRLNLERYREPIPSALRRAVLDRDGHACLRCGTRADLQMDHVHPWSLGGVTTFENLQTLCGPCNRAKGATL